MQERAKIRVCAVSYLNTSPLVWGFLHGPGKGLFDLSFQLPAACADALREGSADIGLVPVIELARQPDLVVIPEASIACQGPVRSILVVSKKPLEEIESLAADTSSRTSVVMTQVVLERKYGKRVDVRPHPPVLDAMLEDADAALIIGDPALHIDPAMNEWRGLPVHVYDMGGEWVELTGLPMVYAVWAAKQEIADPGLIQPFVDSKAHGLARRDEIVAAETGIRDLPRELIRRYITRHISYELGERERRALSLFLRWAGGLGLVDEGVEARYLEPTPTAGAARNA